MLVAAYRSGITDPKELANFMGQVQHESQHFARLEENLNYSGERLYAVFKGRNGLTTEKATELAGIPDRTERQKAIAEQVYGGPDGRARLGNTEPGDGYTFRGRGYMQITGRGNYTALGHATGLDLVNHPELAAEQSNAEKLAIHYWKTQVQIHPSARADVTVAGSLINTGRADRIPKGLADRQASAAAWQKALDSGYLEEALSRHRLPEEAASQRHPTSARSPASLQLLQDSEHHVRVLAEKHGIRWDAGMDNTVLALAAEARNLGLSGITHLKVAQGQIHFAQHDGVSIREGELGARAAANTDATDSLAQLAAHDQQEQTRAQITSAGVRATALAN
ncbi:MAG: glycoside hydrolase family 19 protein, partial [Hydrogenophaga sp.]